MITATTEHCLVGIKGTVRRNYDGHAIHANVDTDVMLSEEPPYGATDKPSELYAIIEHFANGRRRLELFGEDTNIRRGWLTLGQALSSSNHDAEHWRSHFEGSIESCESLGLRAKTDARVPTPPDFLANASPSLQATLTTSRRRSSRIICSAQRRSSSRCGRNRRLSCARRRSDGSGRSLRPRKSASGWRLRRSAPRLPRWASNSARVSRCRPL